MSKTREAAELKFALDRKEHCQTLSDTARMLMAAHKDLLQIRRDSLQGCFNPKFKPLCHSKHFKEEKSNESVFVNGMSKKADEVDKANMLTE